MGLFEATTDGTDVGGLVGAVVGVDLVSAFANGVDAAEEADGVDGFAFVVVVAAVCVGRVGGACVVIG